MIIQIVENRTTVHQNMKQCGYLILVCMLNAGRVRLAVIRNVAYLALWRTVDKFAGPYQAHLALNHRCSRYRASHITLTVGASSWCASLLPFVTNILSRLLVTLNDGKTNLVRRPSSSVDQSTAPPLSLRCNRPRSCDVVLRTYLS